MARSGPPAWARIFYVALGLVLFIAGLLWAWSPIPFGFVLMGAGLAILVWASRDARRLIRRWRMKSRKLDGAMTRIEDVLPGDWTHDIKRTRPENHDDDDDEDEGGSKGNEAPPAKPK
jgi:hypothetical protein